MKKNRMGIILGVMLLLGLVACGNAEKVTEDTSEPGSVEYVYDVTWEELEYAAELPTPAGNINYVMKNEAEQWCSIFVEGMSETDYNEYMDCLYEQGFQVITSKSDKVKGQNYVSIGTALSDGTTGLSVSYADGILGIYISREKGATL